MNFIDLLENYIILKDKNREIYYDIKDNVDIYKDFIYNSLSYDLIIKEDFIKLEKVPGIPEEWMGIQEFKEIKEYIFFIIVIMFLEDKTKEEQFVLSSITEYIESIYPNEKIDWTIFKNRKSLINVMKVSIDIGLIKRNDGNEDEFSKSESGEVLYENTGISRYVVRKFTKDIYDAEDYKDLLEDTWQGISDDKGLVRKNRVYRRLLLSPIVYNTYDDSDYEYIKNYRNYIKNSFEKYLEWDLHIHNNGSLIALSNQNAIKDTFPNQKGECLVTLLINKEIKKQIDEDKLIIREDDTIMISTIEFKNLLLYVRKNEGHGFVKALRECSDDYYIDTIKKFMKSYSMINEIEDIIILMPLICKVVGTYPKDYVEGKNE